MAIDTELVWTKDKPTVEGWYWVMYQGIVYVTYIYLHNIPPAFYFAGPLTEPIMSKSK